MTESTRDQYYKGLPSYSNLREWQTLIKDGQYDTAIGYWKAKNLKHGRDCYVQLKPDNWVPPSYYCCVHGRSGDMIKFLMRVGADIDQLPDSDVCDYLPFACHSLFLRTLSSRHKGGSYKRCDILDRSIAHRLNAGDSQRLLHLITLGLLDHETLVSYVSDNSNIIEQKLQAMIKYLTFCYNVRTQGGDDLNLTVETNRVLNKFKGVVKILLDHQAPVTEGAITLCMDNYLYEIIPIVHPFYSTSLPEPEYHTQLDSTRVAIMRPLLNDNRYVKMCSATGHSPDSEVFNYDMTA
jgi:hypothetical protein